MFKLYRAARNLRIFIVPLMCLLPLIAGSGDIAFARHLGAAYPLMASNQTALDVTASRERVEPTTTLSVPGSTTTLTNTVTVGSFRAKYADSKTLPRPTRSSHNAISLADGRIFISGGYGNSPLDTTEIYDAATKTFTSTANMSRGRFAHTSTLLDDGRVLTTGGGDGKVSLKQSEIYDPATDTFQVTASLAYPRQRHTATLLADGSVLVVGGLDVTGYRTFARNERYNPVSDIFSATGNTRDARFGHTATLLPDGKVLIIGGGAYSPVPNGANYSVLASAEIYDPATGTFSVTGSLHDARTSHTATLLADGTVLLVGGSDRNDRPVASAERYDPISGTFTIVGQSLFARSAHTASILQDGRVYIAGGMGQPGTFLDSTEIYDPATRTFASAPSLHKARGGHTATTASDGTVLIVGGRTQGILRSDELFDPSSNTVGVFGNLHVDRTEHTATLLANGQVLVAGGSSGAAISSAELYDVSTDRWLQTGDLQQRRFEHAATLLQDGRVLIVGGVDDGYLNQTELYDPATGVFTASGNMTTARTSPASALLPDGKVLIAGGHNDQVLKSAELYDPATGTSTLTGSMAEPRRRAEAISLPDGTILIVGGIGPKGEYITQIERYDPITATFTTRGHLSDTTWVTNAVLLTDGTVLVIHPSGTEVYDPVTETSAVVGSLPYRYYSQTAVRLQDGTVLVTGYRYEDDDLDKPTISEIHRYDPVTKLWSLEGTSQGVYGTTATLLSNGSVLIPGSPVRPELLEYVVNNSFKGSLTLPVGWTATPVVTVTGSTTGTLLTYGSLNDGPWFEMQPNTPVTKAVSFNHDGRDQPVTLRLRDADGSMPVVVRGFIDVDTAAPTSELASLPQTSPAWVALKWSGTDLASGIRSYDVDVRDGPNGTWTPLLANTTSERTTFTGVPGHSYYFRVRAYDVAGNSEPWPDSPDAQTTIDTVNPSGSFLINRGAQATTVPTVTLNLSVADTQSAVKEMRIAQGATGGVWESFVASKTLILAGSDGEKSIHVTFRDAVGNVSEVVSQTIRLDTAAGDSAVISINNRALYTNSPTVTLRIGAPAQTWQMQLSNDGGFGDEAWQPFDTAATWTISIFENERIPRTVYVRTRSLDGTIQSTVSDDIIYDPLPPTGSVAITNVDATSVQVTVDANDTASNVVRMRLSTNSLFAGATWKPYATSASISRHSNDLIQVYAQFEDGAGNRSAITCTTPNGQACTVQQGSQVFLPLLRR